MTIKAKSYAIRIFLGFWILVPGTGGTFGSRTGPHIRPYQVLDARYCNLTPQPFLCRKCLARGLRLAQFLYFEEDGRPYREYRCVPPPG